MFPYDEYNNPTCTDEKRHKCMPIRPWIRDPSQLSGTKKPVAAAVKIIESAQSTRRSFCIVDSGRNLSFRNIAMRTPPTPMKGKSIQKIHLRVTFSANAIP